MDIIRSALAQEIFRQDLVSAYEQQTAHRDELRRTSREKVAGLVEQIHAGSPDKGYRRIRDDLARCHQTPINDKRALRICQGLGIRSTIKYAAKGCTRRSRVPQHTAENLLDRDFHAD